MLLAADYVPDGVFGLADPCGPAGVRLCLSVDTRSSAALRSVPRTKPAMLLNMLAVSAGSSILANASATVAPTMNTIVVIAGALSKNNPNTFDGISDDAAALKAIFPNCQITSAKIAEIATRVAATTIAIWKVVSLSIFEVAPVYVGQTLLYPAFFSKLYHRPWQPCPYGARLVAGCGAAPFSTGYGAQL